MHDDTEVTEERANEQALLGHILRTGNDLTLVDQTDLTYPDHKLIHAAAASLNGQGIDPLGVLAAEATDE